jgi:hypothetical protein
MADFFVSMAALGDYFAGEPWGLPGGDGGAEAGWQVLKNVKSGHGCAVRGVSQLSFADERDGERRRKADDDSDDGVPASAVRKLRKKPAAPEVGNALRSAYQRTLDEDIPPEMLDLLGKLG